MSQFKVGDKVRCIRDANDPGHILLKNRAYRISWASPTLVEVNGDKWTWYSNRFEKVIPNRRT